MKMCMYILQSREGVYFKSFNPFTNEVEWTGVKERAAFWKSEDVALDQGLYLKLTGHGEWEVKLENMFNNYD